MRIFIFDIDDTIILHTKENINYYNHPNKNTVLKDLLDEIECDKIYIYTNGTYGHGKGVVDNLYLNVDGIFARDNIPYMKPYIASFNYVDFMIKKENISNNEMYFFDDMLDNLKTANRKGWITIWITNKKTEKPYYVDLVFTNIYEALMWFLIK
tara:strand:+ start:309 stop:770 length:462 start_codon:yes stop_codon:yes gene_type:complete